MYASLAETVTVGEYYFIQKRALEVDWDGESRDEFILSVEIESVVNKSVLSGRTDGIRQ